MPTIQSIPIADNVKVAVVFEDGGIRPVWFQIAGSKPVNITEISAIWYQAEMTIVNFEVGDGKERYCLTYDGEELSWKLRQTFIS